MKKILLLLSIFLVSCNPNLDKTIKIEKNNISSETGKEKSLKNDLKDKDLSKKIINKEKDNKSSKNINGDFLEFCKNIGKINFYCHLGDKNEGFSIFKVGSGEKINYGDYVEVKPLEKLGKDTYNVILYVGKDIFSDWSNLSGITIGSEISIDRIKAILVRKTDFKEYESFVRKEMEKEFKRKVRNIKDKNILKKEKEKFKKELEKTLKQIQGIKNNINVLKDKKILLKYLVFENNKIVRGGETGLTFEKIVNGGNYKYGDKICFKKGNEEKKCIKLEKGNIIHDLIVVGNLGVGTQFRLCYNGGNGGALTEIVK